MIRILTQKAKKMKTETTRTDTSTEILREDKFSFIP